MTWNNYDTYCTCLCLNTISVHECLILCFRFRAEPNHEVQSYSVSVCVLSGFEGSPIHRTTVWFHLCLCSVRFWRESYTMNYSRFFNPTSLARQPSAIRVMSMHALLSTVVLSLTASFSQTFVGAKIVSNGNACLAYMRCLICLFLVFLHLWRSWNFPKLLSIARDHDWKWLITVSFDEKTALRRVAFVCLPTKMSMSFSHTDSEGNFSWSLLCSIIQGTSTASTSKAKVHTWGMQ